MADLLASIVIPLQGSAELPEDCLRAIALQTYSPYEIVLVSAGSVRVPKQSGDLRVVRVEGDGTSAAHLANAGMQAARGTVRVLLMPSCVPVGSSWLADMVAPLADGSAGAVVAGTGPLEKPTAGDAMRRIEAIATRMSPVSTGRDARVRFLSHRCDAFHADVFDEIDGFDEDAVPSPAESVVASLEMKDAGHKILLSGAAQIESHHAPAHDSLPVVLHRAVRWGRCDAALDKLHQVRHIGAGISAAALLSLPLLLLGLVNLKLAGVAGLAVFAWAWFQGIRLPFKGWECPLALVNFAAYAAVIALIRDDWRPDTFGTELHPSHIRAWCWLAALAASNGALLVGKSLLTSLNAAARPHARWSALPLLLPLAICWHLAAGYGYALQTLFGPESRNGSDADEAGA